MPDNSDIEVIQQCLAAILDGPFISDWEFHIRLGVERSDLGDILKTRSFENTPLSETAQLAINNCMNEVSHGLRISTEQWETYFTVPKDTVRNTFVRWRKSQGFT